MSRTPPHRHGLGRALAAVALVVTTVSVGSGAGAEGLCDSARAAHDRVLAQIGAHNARPNVFTVPHQLAAANAYNAEAASLNAQEGGTFTALTVCLETEQMLAAPGPGSAPLRTRPPPSRASEIEAARKNLPPNRQPSGQSPSRAGYRVPDELRPLYQALRKDNPGRLGDVTLQGRARPKVGDPDPAYPGQRIVPARGGGPAVSPDHIVPLSKVVDLPGFSRLSAENMYIVANSPKNLQWLSMQANAAKASRSMGYVQGLSPGFRAQQIAVEARVRQELELVIQRLLASQG